jgi:hypothetical protein
MSRTRLGQVLTLGSKSSSEAAAAGALKTPRNSQVCGVTTAAVPFGCKRETAFDEASGKVRLRFGVRPLAIVSKCLVLLSPSKIWHVGYNQGEVAREDLRGFRDALRRYGQFMNSLIRGFLAEGSR